MSEFKNKTVNLLVGEEEVTFTVRHNIPNDLFDVLGTEWLKVTSTYTVADFCFFVDSRELGYIINPYTPMVHKPDYFKSIVSNPINMDENNKWVRNWFSNMAPIPIEIDGITWPSVENYYQAMKTDHVPDQIKFLDYTPSQAKQQGRKLKLREDWDEIKEGFMTDALVNKFMNNLEQRQLLFNTGNAPIVEWNNWNDTYWGVDIRSFLGYNRLGEILMSIRNQPDFRKLFEQEAFY